MHGSASRSTQKAGAAIQSTGSPAAIGSLSRGELPTDLDPFQPAAGAVFPLVLRWEVEGSEVDCSSPIQDHGSASPCSSSSASVASSEMSKVLRTANANTAKMHTGPGELVH